jgi:PAS domain S-box-containing protein
MNLTEQERADRVVRESEELRRAAFEAIPTMCFVVDEAGLLVAVNAFGARSLGYSAGELLGRSWLNLFYEPDRNAVRAHAQDCFREVGRVAHWEARKARRDGQIMQVRETGHAVLANDRAMLFISCEDITERKRVDEALRQSERYLAEAQRLAHTGSWTHDHLTGMTTHYSDETFRLFGLDPRRGYVPQLDEILQLMHPEDRERIGEEYAQIIRDKAEYAQDYRIVLHDGKVRHLQSIGHPVLGPGGELLAYFGTAMDVTERRRAEQRLLVQTRVTHILSEASTVKEAMPKILQVVCESLAWHLSVLWWVDRQANVLRCADVWCVPSVAAAEFKAATRASTFVPGSDLPGRVWVRGGPACTRDVSHDAEFSREKVAAHAGFRGAFAFPILLGSEVLGVIESFTRDLWQPDGDLVAMMSTMGSQIGQFAKRAAAVDELQLRVGMLQSIPVAAWSVMPDGTPDIVNQLWYEYTGQSPEYVNSHPEAWMATMHPEDRERASRIYWDGVRSGRGFAMEARFLRAKDGEYRWHLNRAVAVRDSEGNIVRLVGTSTDVHDLRVAQEELRNTETKFAHMTRVMTMGELTASIAHEVNQPLGAIVTSAASCTRWLAAQPPQMDKARRALERIASDGRRAAEVIQRIRALMKRQAPRKSWLDINETIVEVLELTQQELRRSEIGLETQLGADLPPVHADRVQLQQVLLNLIVNAIEAMGGIEERRRLLTILSFAQDPETVRVEVRDSGTGLDPEHATRVFESFYTTKPEGLGIGLSISRSIVEAHGGHLGSGANMPHGAVFWFMLPVNESLP